jgi:mannose-6-phosphate isomerase-like protein (cupin superfamily)
MVSFWHVEPTQDKPTPVTDTLQTTTPLEHDERPWGSYDVLAVAPHFKLKLLHVKPGARLSLQRHQQRLEHWVVVAGVAEVEIDGQASMLSAGQHVLIPLLAKHRLRNPGDTLLTVAEIATGAAVREDDIERFDDDYGRAKP